MDLSFKEIGTGFLIGFCIGFAIKKGLKLLALVTGSLLVIIFILEFFGISAIDNDQLINSIENSRSFLESGYIIIKERIKDLELQGAIGAGVGAVSGFKFG